MNDRLGWYNEAKLGLFVHWGPYSQAGVEASWPIMIPGFAKLFGGKGLRQDAYEGLAKTFDPTSFDAGRWVRTARAAGMRYLVFTAKHHDGFCMFDAPGTDYKITNTPFGRDVVGELSAACAGAGMRFGLYYSPPDMHHPGYRDTSRPAVKNWQGEPDRPAWSTYLDYMERHLRHLLTAYSDVDLLWFDGLVEQGKYDPKRFHRLIRDIRPEVVVNDRLGQAGDFITPEQGIPDGIPVVGEGDRPELSAAKLKRLGQIVGLPGIRQIVRKRYGAPREDPKPLSRCPVAAFPPEDRFQPWETCITMNRTWAYSPDDTVWKPSELLMRLLARVAASGGNFLLNVGPDPLGCFPDSALERLESLGKWMAVNGEAIYGASYGRPTGIAEAVATRRGDRSYLIVLEGPDGAVLSLPSGYRHFREATLLGSGRTVQLSSAGEGVEITLPEELAIEEPVVIRLDRAHPTTPDA